MAVFKELLLRLPWLLGRIFACLGAALLGVSTRGVRSINHAMWSVLGAAVGATFVTAILASMIGMWTTLIMTPVLIILSVLAGVPYFQYLWGFDVVTYYYSTMPGGLHDMLTFGEEAGGDVRALSLIHATRVTVIVMALPFALHTFVILILTTHRANPWPTWTYGTWY